MRHWTTWLGITAVAAVYASFFTHTPFDLLRGLLVAVSICGYWYVSYRVSQSTAIGVLGGLAVLCATPSLMSQSLDELIYFFLGTLAFGCVWHLLDQPAYEHYARRLTTIGGLFAILSLFSPASFWLLLAWFLPLTIKFERNVSRLWWYVGTASLTYILSAWLQFWYTDSGATLPRIITTAGWPLLGGVSTVGAILLGGLLLKHFRGHFLPNSELFSCGIMLYFALRYSVAIIAPAYSMGQGLSLLELSLVGLFIASGIGLYLQRHSPGARIRLDRILLASAAASVGILIGTIAFSRIL